MTVSRVEVNGNFTLISNEIFKRIGLMFLAKGFWVKKPLTIRCFSAISYSEEKLFEGSYYGE